MSPIAKLNAGTLFLLVCLIALPNATALGGTTILSPDQSSASLAPVQLAL